jgi:protein-S-isoprenylcysteine O-methyltransferase Ste14
VYLYLKGTPYTPPVFKVTTLYKIVRHPLLLGFMIAFWSTPHMTAGHFLFALITTLYMLIAIQLEERDLGTVHGEAYERYREEVRMILPLPRGKR